MDFDLVIHGGKVYAENGLLEADLGITDGKIAAITKTGFFGHCPQTFDASGKYVLPGAIDTHAHFRDPGYTHKEDFTSGTMAAVAGGVTMFVDMPNTRPVPNTAERYLEHKKIAEAKSLIDFNHWGCPTNFPEIPKIATLGAAGFKFYMKGSYKDISQDVYPYMSETYIGNEYSIIKVFESVKQTGLPVTFHPWNMDIWKTRADDAIAHNDTSHDGYLRAVFAENLTLYTSAVAKMVGFARLTGVRLRVCHANWVPMFELIREAKSSGLDVTAEMNVWQCFDRATPKGLQDNSRAAYPRYFQQSMEEVYRALSDGTIDFIATDHSPHLKEEMDVPNGFEAASGVPCIQHYLPILLTEVYNGNISLETFVNTCSEKVAKYHGFYPQKGAIRVGSDADLTVVELGREQKITSDRLYTKCRINPYEGLIVKGMPVATFVRGSQVMEDGEVSGKAGFGRFVPATPQQPTGSGLFFEKAVTPYGAA